MAEPSTATLLRKARLELRIIAELQDHAWLNAGLRITAKACDTLAKQIDAHLASLEEE